jgi:hypothetical protein
MRGWLSVEAQAIGRTMIKFYRILAANSEINWALGQFPDEVHALAQYNSEVRREHQEGIRERPELEFIQAKDREVEYWLGEEEITHTPEKRDATLETGRWGLARKAAAKPGPE